MALDIYGVLNDYPTLKNEFLHALTNQVVKTQFFEKVYQNKLQLLHKGTLEYGDSIEELFVDMAVSKGFYDNFDNIKKNGQLVDSNNDEKDLLAQARSNIHKLYVSKNFAEKYKVSISEDRLRGAFRSSTGLYALVQRLLSSLTSGANRDEYERMKMVVQSGLQGKQIGATFESSGKGKLEIGANLESAQDDKLSAVQSVYTVPVDMSDISNLSVAIRTVIGDIQHASTEYNQAGVTNWAEPEELMFLSTSSVYANLDVKLLANAFNVSMADLKTRNISVDKNFFPTENLAIANDGSTAFKEGTISFKTATVTRCKGKVVGVLMDSNYVQYWNTLVANRQFDNADLLLTNNFLHVQGIASQCFFAPMVVFVDKDTYQTQD